MSVEILILDKLKEQSMVENKVREFSSINLLRSLFECISFNTSVNTHGCISFNDILHHNFCPCF